MEIADDFPRFQAPGYEQDMDLLRSLHWLHYGPAKPLATLWDEWLSGPTLWPALHTGDAMETIRKQWSDALSGRIIDAEGYVATHQHASIAHQLGWPFPSWNRGDGGCGWHFSFKDTAPPPWRGEELSTPTGWETDGVRDDGIGEDGWRLTIAAPRAALATPATRLDTFQAPFIQLRWQATGLGNARPYLEWVTRDEPRFGPERRFYVEPIDSSSVVYTMVPLYKHPRWSGEVTGMRIGLGNADAGGSLTIQALFSQYDTRHNINNQNFIRGCVAYVRWTRDITFLRRNINRMRMALRYVMTELQALERNYVFTPWVGHCGRGGLRIHPDGAKDIVSGQGIGNNYWDLLPFGHKDAYATIHYYAAVRDMVAVERDIAAHPEWDIPGGVLRLEPRMLDDHAERVKAEGNRLFWNPQTGRFVPGIDADGAIHDVGCTFLNCEAIYYGFATPEHGESIMGWLCGERTVEGDTARGADIYYWRFAPRATTRRNVDYYGWFWNTPESIPWGGQVQDGGAVLGFSYHDLMARLRTRGADNAWARLREIIGWFGEVRQAGGYRAYYDGTREGTLQGGGTAGGLGLDEEFFESVLVPQVMLDGFLGFAPTMDGCRIDPLLPVGWPVLTIDRIHLHDLVLRVTATREAIEVWKEGWTDELFFVHLAPAEWTVTHLAPGGVALSRGPAERRRADDAVIVRWDEAAGVRFTKAAEGQR